MCIYLIGWFGVFLGGGWIGIGWSWGIEVGSWCIDVMNSRDRWWFRSNEGRGCSGNILRVVLCGWVVRLCMGMLLQIHVGLVESFFMEFQDGAFSMEVHNHIGLWFIESVVMCGTCICVKSK